MSELDFSDILWIRSHLDYSRREEVWQIFTRFQPLIGAGRMDIRHGESYIVLMWEPKETKPFGISTIHNEPDENECLFTTASDERYSDRETTLERILELIRTKGVTKWRNLGGP